MKQLILIRHGEPEMDGTAARIDPALSELGHAQAEHVGARLSGEPIDRIVSSPLRRAHQTALPLADKLGGEVHHVAGIAEVDQDGADYVSVEAWRAEGSAHWDAFLADPVGSLGGDHDVFTGRVRASLDALLAGPGKRIAVFTHGLPINVALAAALGEGSLARFAPRHASVTRMAGSSLSDLRLLSFNEATHLPARPR
ncbi:MAG: histidine phosphatase family protein [Pseudomonadota bacterium]